MHSEPAPDSAAEASWAGIIEALAGRGWVEQRNFLPAPLTHTLYAELMAEWEGGKLQKAGIGRGHEHQVIDSIRGDYIHWLERENASPALRELFALMEQFRLYVNRHLLLGLEDYEVMGAYYPAGTHYGKHLDRFQGTDLRSLTTVIYLNPEWDESNGGQLRVYTDDGNTVDILPRAGTLASFITEGTWHEVLPANRPRLSLTGWYRRRALGGAVI